MTRCISNLSKSAFDMPAYKDTKRGTWYAAFYYTDWQGNKKHTVKRGFTKKSEALEYERNMLNAQSHGADITFANLMKNYLEDMKPRLKPTTMATKEEISDLHITSYFGDMKICNIDSIAVRKWQNVMMQKLQPNGKLYSKTYLKSINSQLSCAMNYAVSNYGLSVNPCKIAGGMGSNKADEMKIWTKDQYETFYGYCLKPAFRLIFNILFFTGCRVGEALALTPADIKPDNRIDINKNFQSVNNIQYYLTPKTQKSKRSISIPSFLYREIQEYINELCMLSPGDRIFYFTRSAVEKEIHRVADLAGLEHIRVHDLRHSHAAMLIHLGVNIKEISERLGHESVKTTLDTYAHLYPDTDLELANKLDNLIDRIDTIENT